MALQRIKKPLREIRRGFQVELKVICWVSKNNAARDILRFQSVVTMPGVPFFKIHNSKVVVIGEMSPGWEYLF